MPKRIATVFFNPSAGNSKESDAHLDLIRTTLEELRVTANVVEITPELDVPRLTQKAALGGAQYIVASGGDNTIDMVARGLVGTRSKLVIVPTGTRNNIAHSLNIPVEPGAATRLIAEGERIKVDMGRVKLDGREILFLELVAVGLGAAVFPAMDEAQKGNLAHIGDLLGTFITHPASNFRLNLDRGRQKLEVQALTMAVLNMPFLGANFQLAPNVDSRDGLLDVFLYADLGKLDLLTHAVQVAQGFTDDPRVKHLRVKHLVVETDPPLPIMIDGQVFQDSRLQVHRAAGALRVMAPKTV